MATPSHGHSDEHVHPPIMQYVLIAAILAIITAIEVATYYIEAIGSALVYILIILSVARQGIRQRPVSQSACWLADWIRPADGN